MKKKYIKKNKIRIISGIFKGHNIFITKKYNIKPTQNIIRETLFNWLNPIIKNATCLDCFAGTGALSIEAISRSAKLATLIELNYHVFKKIKFNLNRLKISNAKIFNKNIYSFLNQKGKKYDIIFIDPPFYKKMVDQTIYLINKNQWSQKNTYIYIETHITDIIKNIPKNWILYRKKKIGKIFSYLYIQN
ncbi:MAG: 16S rRNA (guanine(966)-N(2))-methyltransferase RsmD [Arsenophonus sp.]|nr:MAG: 16S rRNA (guanine(966)-N(2))-methyltransferase RsmD [Arsenophonus sp.]